MKKNCASNTTLLLFSLVLVLGKISLVSCDSLQDKCGPEFTKLGECLSYASAKADTPSPACCGSVTEIRQKDAVCLCYIIQQVHGGGSSVSSMGLQLDRLIKLPAACKLANTNISDCPTVAGASTDADTHAELNDLTVDFRESLDASTLTKANYGNFLTRLRTKLGQLPGASLISDSVALPSQTQPPLRWFHLTLRGLGGKQTTIRFSGDNLYFIGYLMQNSVKWIELGRQGDPHYITEKGTTFTGFRNTYEELQKKAGVESLDKVSLTKQSFNDAIAVLAESTDYQKRAKAVIVVILMVSEACRFFQIGDYLAANIGNPNNFLNSWMEPLVKNWDSYSTMVLLAHNFPNCNVYKPQTINGEVLKTADDLRKKLGVMLRSKISEVNPCQKYGEDDDELRPNVVNFQARKDYVEPADVQAP